MLNFIFYLKIIIKVFKYTPPVLYFKSFIVLFIFLQSCTADINGQCPTELRAPGGCNSPWQCLVAIDTAAPPWTAAVGRQVTPDSSRICAQMRTVTQKTLPLVYLLVPKEPAISIQSSFALRTLQYINQHFAQNKLELSYLYIYGGVVIKAGWVRKISTYKNVNFLVQNWKTQGPVSSLG